MALINCKECGQQVSSKAESCPNCGASVKRKGMGCGTLIGVVFIGAIAIGGFQSALDGYNGTKVKSQAESKALSEREKEQIRELSSLSQFLAGQRWDYSVQTDEMSGKQTMYAMLMSANTVEFSSPYGGEQRATLSLRTHPRYGKNVLFQIDRGQLLCSYGGCNILIRFGDAEAVNYTASRPEDNSSTLLFIRNYHAFVESMMSVDVVRISPSVYREGNPVFEFQVKGFDADKYLQR